MPDINRIRVNNVKYNFGTQYYDDFTMKMFGKNTLYDLANGGGKSVLMLLLLQNLIPNCTLDDKQPVEKLFRTGSGNTVIHSLVEWRLDFPEQNEGYNYMTTGFCARKTKDEDSENRDVAAIEYFNYCIFYREYNKNDIINLSLTSDGEKVTFQGLKSYLKELEHKDMSLRVRVFERKGEYQRYISEYGLHESQWEIIRGINKTEGHVRTYFENNYKTTRKVVEDLLIEEIIEKAFMVKTGRENSNETSMAKLLMDIKEQLAVLARRKKEIAGYDRQIELVDILKSKLESFMGLYREHSELTGTLADICVTGAEFAKNDEEKMQTLLESRDKKLEEKSEQKYNLECIMVAKDKHQAEELEGEIEDIKRKLDDHEKYLNGLKRQLNIKESINDYIEYIKDRDKLNQYSIMHKVSMESSNFDEEKLYCYAGNIKVRLDVTLADVRGKIEEAECKLTEIKLQREYHEKLVQEARIECAVKEDEIRIADEEIQRLTDKTAACRMQMNELKFSDSESVYLNLIKEVEQIGENLVEVGDTRDREREQKLNLELLIGTLENNKKEFESRVTELSKKQEYFQKADEKLSKLREIYGAQNLQDINNRITNRITNAILEQARLEGELKLSSKLADRLKEGRLLTQTKGIEEVIDYIETRHGISAIYGMDYLSALTSQQQIELLRVNPELPFGVVVDNYETLKEDPNIQELDTGAEIVNLYDITRLSETASYYGDNVMTIHKNMVCMTEDDAVDKLIETEKIKTYELEGQIQVKQEMLIAYRQDQQFVISLIENEFEKIDDGLARLTAELEQIEKKLGEKKREHRACKTEIEKSEACYEELDGRLKIYTEDLNLIRLVNELSGLINDKQQIKKEALERNKVLEEKLTALTNEGNDTSAREAELKSMMHTYKASITEMMSEWENNYEAYYNPDLEPELLDISTEDIKARFMGMISANNKDARLIEDRKLLMDTIKASMEKSLKNIEKHGIELSLVRDYEAKGLLYVSDDESLQTDQKNIFEVEKQIKNYEKELSDKIAIVNRLYGNVDYAIAGIEKEFHKYDDINATAEEISNLIENGENILHRLDNEAKFADEEYKRYFRQQGYMVELYKDVKRIVLTNDIDISKAVPMLEDKDKLRDIFEEALMSFDRNNKLISKAGEELLRLKSNTANVLDEMNDFELAASIRNDIVLPKDAYTAESLVKNLECIIDFIRLEKDRIEQSLVDMKTLKANFEEQCIQRCLDVKTELDKINGLSRIMVDGEAIQMVGLTVPYLKEEYIKQRMSDYIDSVVSQTDDYKDDNARIKFIKGSLALKRLFSVIVTDMNGIKLNLYKRERIKEQSRYLRYEEAVGSTGQSQGIYIQFLVSVINYISGMYSVGNEDTRTKTIFIDNPFGAAKDLYIWEPIFAMLKANNVQLIVPARGVTPAITGRFDVNYILGQQMSNGRQLTVVTNYTSKAEQEDLEYKALDYEQVSFDFI